jgi:tRNA(Ile)-lysidine synthetase-like protein
MWEFFYTFSKYIKLTDTLILAVSGGVDSMVLFDMVIRNHPREKIIVAHFDHSLRWTESDGDRDLVANICNRENIQFEVEKMDIATIANDEKMSIEAVARKYRYRFLERVAEKYSAKYILTAHHLDDRIETAMFNLIRGTKLGGIHALWELKIKNEQLNIIRPFIYALKSEILEYAWEKHIEYREDSSNMSTDYQRNHLRLEVLPRFEKINPEYRQSIQNFIEYTEDLKLWIDSEIANFLWERKSFSVKDFGEKSSFFQKEIIRYIYEQANSGTIGLSEGNIEELLRYVLTANGGTEKKIGNLMLTKRWQEISWGK